MKHIQVTALHEVREELQEERDEQQPDVHAIHIGIGGDHHLVVPQRVEAVFDVEGGLKQVEFLVLVHHLLGESKAVQGLPLQAEDRLGGDVACLGDGS